MIKALKRPLYVVGMSFALSLLAATVMGYHTAFMAAVLCALLFLPMLAVKRLRQYEGVTAALLAACAAFAVFTGWEYLTVQPLQRMDGETVELTLWTEEAVGETDRSLTYFARVRDGALPRDTRVLLRVTNSAKAPQLYDRVQAAVRLEATDEWRAQNVFLTVWVNDCTVSVSDERPRGYALQNRRTHLLSKLETKADGDVAALLRAICFGDKSTLSDAVRDNFAAAGISHITAVSGFHMNIISLGVFSLLCFLGLRRRWAALCSMPIPFLFAALTGFSYSAMRAGVMACLMLAAAVFRREAEGCNSLGGAVIGILALDITAIYDIGFQLSVAATWGILLASRLQPQGKTTVWRTMGRGLQLTAAAVMATLPLSALHFGEISALSPLTNLVAQPLASVVVSVGCVGTLLLGVPFLGFVGAPCVLIAGIAARGLLAIGEIAAALPFAALRLQEPYLVIWALSVPFALLLGWRLLRGRGLRITAMLLVIVFCLSTLVFRLGMRGVTVLSAVNVSGGTIVVLERDGRHAAVMAGDPSLWQARNALTARHITQLDAVLFAADDTAAVQTAVDVGTFALSRAADRSPDGMTITLWEDTVIWWQDGWCRVTVGEHTVLIAPCGGEVHKLPAAYRTADIAVFDRTPPQNAAELAVGEAMLCCGKDDPASADTLLGVAYPITVTDDTVTVKVR
ncbi:MAG: ComEC/Rec2 family competence protein [Ruminococcaceae bacterium]|nr:ComEC/Rec2 family competence protein [Oscillospiraceae bacterium]